AGRQRSSCVGTTLVPSGVKLNFRVQRLSTFRPATVGGRNFQRCADCKASRAKYLLGPPDKISAFSTLPEESTSTPTLTLTVPLMLSCALSETLGRTRSITSPRTIAAAGA